MGDNRAHHQPVAVLHQHMPLVAQDGGGVAASAVQPRIRVGPARVGVVAPGLTFPAGLRVAPAVRGRLVVRPILWAEALLAGPGLNQRAIHREMLFDSRLRLSASLITSV